MRVPYALPVYDNREIDAVTASLKSRKSIIGEKTSRFEEKVAALFGKKYGIMVNSGSSANLLAVELLKLPPGAEVVTPALTFSTTVAPLLQKQLKPIFVDVEMGSYLASISEIESAITRHTKCILIPSLIGNVPDFVRLRRIADSASVPILEDSCDTLGAKISGKSTGSFTDITTTSFYGSHIITAAGGGGMVCVNSKKQDTNCRVLRGWGRSSAVDESEDVDKRFATNLGGAPYDSKFIFSDVGYNFLPLEISAAFGLEQLKKLGMFARIRKANFAELNRFFAKYSRFFILPRQLENVDTAWLAFPLTIKTDAPFSRAELVIHLERNGIQTRPIFAGNILRQPAFASLRKGRDSGRFPNADAIMHGGLLIGCNQGLTSSHIAYMKDVFDSYLEKFG